MSMVSPVNIYIGFHPYFPAVHEYISASQTGPKSHMSFGTLLRILLRLALSLIIFIIPSSLFFQGEFSCLTYVRTHKYQNSNVLRMAGGGTWKPVHNKDGHTRSRSPN